MGLIHQNKSCDVHSPIRAGGFYKGPLTLA
jgi:hypothetical protein